MTICVVKFALKSDFVDSSTMNVFMLESMTGVHETVYGTFDCVPEGTLATGVQDRICPVRNM